MHILYKTTNLMTGRYYIGVHNSNLDDGYLGSGIELAKDIEIYQPENFKREIIAEYKTAKSALMAERAIVNKEFVLNPLTYNCVVGGRGGWEHTDPKNTTVVKDSDGNCFRVSRDDPRLATGELVGVTKGRVMSETEKQIRSKALIGKKKSKNHGKKISEYAKNCKWMNRDGVLSRVPLHLIPSRLDEGWVFGKKI